ncbi:alpha-tocopherol transfer protein-like [Arctopsyche grandis]|uniref:alpha-tocopherol transfer protein-like n=1 Tax=Arctopsyche grandis TaxID=121162 RepID=UPI00406D7E98
MAADLGFDYDTALASNSSFKQQDLEDLKKWLKELDSSTAIPKDIHDKQLLIFYNAGLANVENTKKCIKQYYTMRDNAPEHFDNRDCEEKLMKESLKSLEFFVLPEKTDEGYDVVFHRLVDFEPEKYHSFQACKLLFMTIDAYLYEKGPQPGFIFLFDMRGVRLGHLTRSPLSSVSKFCQYVQEGLPVNMKGIHVMNVTPFFDKVLLLLKPFLRKEVLKMIHLHHANDDMDKFFKECLPKRCVPPDFGGEASDTQSLHLKNNEKIVALKHYFDAEEKHRHTYCKKSKKKSKIENGFQDLNID